MKLAEYILNEPKYTKGLLQDLREIKEPTFKKYLELNEKYHIMSEYEAKNYYTLDELVELFECINTLTICYNLHKQRLWVEEYNEIRKEIENK